MIKGMQVIGLSICLSRTESDCRQRIFPRVDVSGLVGPVIMAASPRTPVFIVSRTEHSLLPLVTVLLLVATETQLHEYNSICT